MDKPFPVVISAIAAITGIELFALSQGVNGQLMTLTVAAIAGLGGYKIKDLLPRGK